jgi:CMP-N,N'-diacetyllegionaminic acid synthase
MHNGKRILAVIPARGGSIAVPRKNIRPLGGRPLIAWTFEQVRSVAELDMVVVSTEDAEIRALAERGGVRVVDRPAKLATATAPTEPALLHALDVLETEGTTFDYVGVLEPTSPFRRPETIAECIRTIIARDGVSLMTVRETRSVYGRLSDGYFRPLFPGAPRRRQEREPLFMESSTVYFARVDWLRRTRTLVTEDWLAVTVDEREGFDINTPEDFLVAEAIAGYRS